MNGYFSFFLYILNKKTYKLENLHNMRYNRSKL